MSSYGTNPFPRTFGGSTRTSKLELQALVTALAPGYGTDPSTESYAELYAYAVAVGMIWSVNDRLRNQSIPAKMLEVLPDWEQILKTPPTNDDTVQQRRKRVAAKLRGLGGNALGDIYDTCSTLAGANFVGLGLASPSQQWAYWPGISPGPPGYEWCSNRCAVAIKLTRSGLSDDTFFTLRNSLWAALDALVPAWMTFVIGTFESGFITSLGTVGVTLL